jgi:hypothetical protein
MRRRPLLALVLLLAACSGSEPNGPEAGTFTASLTGARTSTLSGAAIAGVVYTEVGVNFTVQMVVDESGDTDLFLTLKCPRTDIPVPGSYTIDAAESGCGASYSRAALGPDRFQELEGASATSGSFQLEAPESGSLAGTFSFAGPLVVDGDTVGDLSASGRYNATLIGGGAARAPDGRLGRRR